MRYFLHLGYDGSKYHGWQWQPNVSSVQDTIQQKLKKIFKSDITVYGCGRTDAGVHASQYIAHVNLENELDFDLKFRLNKNLPDDISIYEVIKMSDDQHSRYDAISRTYDYFIHLYEDPVLWKFSSFYALENLDFEAMKKAAAILTKYKDFKTICKQPHLHNHTLCEVSQSKIFISEDKQRLHFTITANRFLRGMIRLSVAFFLKIGTGELSFEQFEELLANQIEVENKKLAISNGLYLSKVEYPYLKIDTKSDFASFLKIHFKN